MAFVGVILINICLGIFLISSVLAQKNDITSKDQLPIIAEVVRQTDIPVLITLINVDSSTETHQSVNYSIQNLSQKAISALVLLHNDESASGGVSINHFQSFGAGKTIQSTIFEEKANIKPNHKIFISVDYILFEDGSSWGRDSQLQSQYILGYYEGQRISVSKIKETLQNNEAFLSLIQKPIEEFNYPFQNVENEKRQRGIISGYRSVLARLQIIYETKGIEAVLPKLEEIEKSLKMEVK